MSGQRHATPWVLLVLLSAGAAWAGAAPDQGWQSETVVQASTWSPTAAAQGQVTAWREISLTAPVTLLVESVSVQPGQRVARGQTLATINADALRAQLANLKEAERRTNLAEQRLGDVRQRLGDRLATRSDVLQAQTDLSQARSEANSAWQVVQDLLMQLGHPTKRETLALRLAEGSPEDLAREWATVCAPLPAVVAERAVATGSRVVAGDLLFRLQDLSRVIVDIWVAQGQASAWLHGIATMDGADGGPIRLEALTDVPEVDRQTGLSMLRFAAPNDGQRLLAGQWVAVRREGPPQDIVWVPAAAAVGRAGKTYCIRHRDDRIEAVEVTVGPEQDGRIPVLDGLKAGDRVVTEGAYLLLYRDLNQLMRFQD
jgi:multidrug efflux pump subunit AcrA (membrane-fusion protein)